MLILLCIMLACSAAGVLAAGIDGDVARSIASSRPDWLVELCGRITPLGDYRGMTVVTCILTLVLALLRSDVRVVLIPVAAVVLAMVTTTQFKQVVGRDRPSAPIATRVVSGKSFPSGHASGTMALAAALVLVARPGRQRRWVLVTALPAATLVALTRPCLGVHYASDILAGMCLGIACALMSAALLTPTRSWPVAWTRRQAPRD